MCARVVVVKITRRNIIAAQIYWTVFQLPQTKPTRSCMLSRSKVRFRYTVVSICSTRKVHQIPCSTTCAWQRSSAPMYEKNSSCLTASRVLHYIIHSQELRPEPKAEMKFHNSVLPYIYIAFCVPYMYTADINTTSSPHIKPCLGESPSSGLKSLSRLGAY